MLQNTTTSLQNNKVSQKQAKDLLTCLQLLSSMTALEDLLNIHPEYEKYTQLFRENTAVGGALAMHLLRLEEEKERLKKEKEKLKEEIMIDDLTQLYNVRYHNIRGSEEIKRATRYEHPFSYAILDIDHFKEYNDEYGHNAGDIALKTIAEIIKSEIRRGIDIVYRIGGEEFAVMLPETCEKEAASSMERVRKKIEDACKTYETKLKQKLTVSIGIATYYPEQIIPKNHYTVKGDITKLKELADHALMKEAKKNGKNRVVCYSELLR